MSMVIGRGNVAIATTTKSFEDLGFDDSKIFEIIEVGPVFKSWKPGRVINSMTGIIAGRGYWITPKIDFDIAPDLALTVQQVVLEGDGEFIVYP